MKRIILGTAQFGIPYGITNPERKISQESATEILDAAVRFQIDCFDTAFSYGDSISTLGNHFKKSSQKPQIINKVKNLNDFDYAKEIRSIDSSLEVLGIDKYDSLLLHDPVSLNSSTTWEFLVEAKEKGKVKKIGASIYSPLELESCSFLSEIEILQLPLNLLSSSEEIFKSLTKLFPKKLPEIHVRSIFLQGLLLSDPQQWPLKISQESRSQIRDFLSASREKFDCTALELCIRYISSISWVNGVVFGVYSLHQLVEIVKAFTLAPLPPEALFAFEKNKPLMTDSIIDPRSWSKNAPR